MRLGRNFLFANFIAFFTSNPATVAEHCENPPPLVTFPNTMPAIASNCTVPIEGTHNLTLATFRLPRTASSRYDFMEVFRELVDCPRSIKLFVHYASLYVGGTILNLIINCNHSDVIQLRIDIGQGKNLRTALDYSPVRSEGGLFRLHANCSPFTEGYRIELDNVKKSLRFDRGDSAGLMIFKESSLKNVSSFKCNCSAIKPKFETMWRCKEMLGVTVTKSFEELKLIGMIAAGVGGAILVVTVIILKYFT